jgi:hypothetical protein
VVRAGVLYTPGRGFESLRSYQRPMRERDDPTIKKPPVFATPHRDDRRVGYGQGWVLVAGMACLAAVFLGIVWNAAPRGWRGPLVAAGTAAALFFLLAPAAAVLTRRLYRRARRR